MKQREITRDKRQVRIERVEAKRDNKRQVRIERVEAKRDNKRQETSEDRES